MPPKEKFRHLLSQRSFGFRCWLTEKALQGKTHPFLTLSQLLFGLSIIFFPFQIRTLVFSGPLYLHGNFNPYTSFFIYLNDFFIAGAFFCWGMAVLTKEKEETISCGEKKTMLILLAMLAIFIFSSVFVQNKALHLLTIFRYGEWFLLYLLAVNKVLSRKTILLLFLGTVCFQAIIALFQYLFQHSLGLRFFGEPVATIKTPGVAKIDLFGRKILRAFGTFPHANILGGALGIGIVMTFMAFPKNRWIRALFLLLLCAALLFSFSRSAFLGVVACFFVFIVLSGQKIPWRVFLLTLGVIFFLIISFHLENILISRIFFGDSASMDERLLYFDISQKMLLKEPGGVGLGAFTLAMQQYTSMKLAPWIYQPVHNIFFLMANEGGILASFLFISLFVYLFYRTIVFIRSTRNATCKKELSLLLGILAVIATIGLCDHYFISLYQGQYMLFLVFGLISGFIAELQGLSKKS